jgi:hypothetical protein
LRHWQKINVPMAFNDISPVKESDYCSSRLGHQFFDALGICNRGKFKINIIPDGYHAG